MKVTFYANFISQHLLPFCLELKKRLGDDFKYVSAEKISGWRLESGFEDLDNQYDFIVRSYESKEAYDEAKRLALESDVVIIWAAANDNELIEERLKQDKLTFRGTYRIFLFRDGLLKFFSVKNIKKFYNLYIKYRKNKNLHLLCYNSYAPQEFKRFGLYKDKIYKWGFFPPTKIYDIEKLIESKEENKEVKIIWVGRFIKWKHPDFVLRLANNLKKQGYKFKIQMLGTGELEDKIRQKIKIEKLEDVIEVVGQVPMENVKDYMEKANIFIGTSDSREGWGAVINEAMNAGCAIVANRRMGSVPFLMKDNDTGLMYENYRDFENKVKQLIDNKEEREKFAKNAYRYIITEWSGEKAAQNFIEQCNSIINNEELKIKNGPGSKI